MDRVIAHILFYSCITMLCFSVKFLMLWVGFILLAFAAIIGIILALHTLNTGKIS